ncbi:dsRNA-binding PKR inhibitor [Eptesipox virus]|uniref:DsRNA-binding PKR inhibitor n=1 Tax=Eptesipox virus TaxID=1329402 RepID=A0A220T6A0_9POXV|nr:dsRNA-binding PKR inhibitor [Eptesipox virus]ASK51238.1 dsRNA-binding PKR inhibitor [Eptesipox virus]WAH70996.1 dsRNA-binding PKR inhibitor [Eptesipox virus]
MEGVLTISYKNVVQQVKDYLNSLRGQKSTCFKISKFLGIDQNCVYMALDKLKNENIICYYYEDEDDVLYVYLPKFDKDKANEYEKLIIKEDHEDKTTDIGFINNDDDDDYSYDYGTYTYVNFTKESRLHKQCTSDLTKLFMDKVSHEQYNLWKNLNCYDTLDEYCKFTDRSYLVSVFCDYYGGNNKNLYHARVIINYSDKLSDELNFIVCKTMFGDTKEEASKNAVQAVINFLFSMFC